MRGTSALNLACLSWALVLSGVLVLRPATAPAQAPPGPRQLAAAVLPLPAELRSGAGVVTVDRHGQPHVWRPSANGMVCIADMPGDATFDVRCYQASFIPLRPWREHPVASPRWTPVRHLARSTGDSGARDPDRSDMVTRRRAAPPTGQGCR
jgi:hypothetical protein